ncbi:glycosyltransferase family 2 protein [Winogradskyella echinorum]|uniref:Glycosyltransferase family 2 protein n=1 Tax=Winogradskyella echinorum TaxID=538189 RepID=A0ABR6Y2H8_9FLAO|nr:glycosyltransferase family A protein [Winogradskyella echinorum]MBC3846946.1 glycosyltransferase family 2 protein [Winogradskyella echinorum]MBC5751294.1 glycosyltransferase family 2 protein [Winogradskyella echinorum]
MRVGMNPQKQSKKIRLKCQHRLIIVVFIPSLEGYYRNVLEVFKLCLDSAITTTNSNCAITVVNNASCKEVARYLDVKLEEDKIDTVIHYKENIGKIDALIGAARASREPIITISDVDILFQQGWQEETENIFTNIKGVASVSPIPCRNFKNYETSSTLGKILLGKVKFKYKPIPENHIAQNKYLESFHWELETNENVKWPVIDSNGVNAIVGSGHQILSMRRELFFSTVPKEPSLTLVGNNSEYLYCDQPINFSGGMRLTTYNNYAFHMGNTVENWMLEVQKKNILNLKNKITPLVINELPVFKPKSQNMTWYKFKKRVVHKLFNVFYKNK